MPKTIYDKIWDDHLVHQQDDGTSLLFVDRHLIHEVTSPQAFEGLRNANRKVRNPNLTLAVVDHNIPTTDRSKGIDDDDSRIQIETLNKNCKEFGVQLFGVDDKRQGIVHIVGPEQGFTQPGTVIVCGDSHTATHGAFGALAFGIGTSEVEHVLGIAFLGLFPLSGIGINSFSPKILATLVVGLAPCPSQYFILSASNPTLSFFSFGSNGLKKPNFSINLPSLANLLSATTIL